MSSSNTSNINITVVCAPGAGDSSPGCVYCGNVSLGPLVGQGYGFTQCFEATLSLGLLFISLAILVPQILYTLSLPSIKQLRSKVAYRYKGRSLLGNRPARAESSIATGSVASGLAISKDGDRTYAIPLIDPSRGANYGSLEASLLSSSPVRRSARGSIHQEAAMARFPGVPAPRPGPLRRGDPEYLQKLRMALQADMRDAEGSNIRRFAVFICVSLAVLALWQGIVLLGDVGASGHLHLPQIAEACLQLIIWCGSAALLGLEGTKGVHTSASARLTWLIAWLSSMIKCYDLVVPTLMGTPSASATYDVSGTVPTAAKSLALIVTIQIALTTINMVLAALIYCRHMKSELYDLEREATVIFQYGGSPGQKRNIFRRLLVFAGVDMALLITGILGSMIAAGSNIGFQVMFGKVLEAIVHAQLSGKNTLDGKIAIQLVYAFGIFLGNILQMGFIEMTGTRLVSRLQRYTFAAIVEQDMGFFDVHKTGELTTILTANTSLIRNGTTTQLALAIKGFVQFVAILTYLLITNSSLTGFFMGIALIPLVVAGLALGCVAKLTKKMTDSQANQVRLSLIINYTITNFATEEFEHPTCLPAACCPTLASAPHKS